MTDDQFDEMLRARHQAFVADVGAVVRPVVMSSPAEQEAASTYEISTFETAIAAAAVVTVLAGLGIGLGLGLRGGEDAQLGTDSMSWAHRNTKVTVSPPDTEDGVAPAPTPSQELKAPPSWLFGVPFARNAADLDENAMSSLRRWVEALPPGGHFTIRYDHLELNERRAEAVRAALVEAGTAAGAIGLVRDRSGLDQYELVPGERRGNVTVVWTEL
ncbi:hypothetical protein [Lentzea kentuckyensis]|uniref:hypothetical protein n=1 Tax=Lentzea kentuckyensis TaxID=360086 RepID=UPI000A389EBB|nr:hypothetical protein [Lentzea kentuckyensis]